MTLEEDFVSVWPENHESWLFWQLVDGQWRMGPAGPVALDYSYVRSELARLNLTVEQEEAIFSDVRTCEAGALEEIYRKDD